MDYTTGRMMATSLADPYSEPLVTFDDVLIVPKFSLIESRKDVDLKTVIGKTTLQLPVISANMSSITEEDMAETMHKAGGLGILHRFCSIEKNLEMYRNTRVEIAETGKVCPPLTIGVSVGVSDGEKERAEALIDAGADIICVDVAHGAQISVVQQVVWLREKFKDNVQIIVGNFATADSIREFANCLNFKTSPPPIFKVGIGPGSVCTTRMKTGCGIPQLSAIMDCVGTGFDIIADGGMRYPGDIAKALAAGAKAVMLGGMLAGTQETPGEIEPDGYRSKKIYRGSASSGYGNGWKTSEGETIVVPYRGPVEPILKDIEGGLRSAFTYVGAANLPEFKDKSRFVRVTFNTQVENNAHAKV